MAVHPKTCLCAECGAPSLLLDFGYQLPDCIWDLPEPKRSSRNTSNFAELGARRFVRGLLPIKVEGGEEFRYGVWLEVAPSVFDEILAVWDDEPRYRTLRFAAMIANAAPPWRARILGVAIEAGVRDPQGRPFVLAAGESWLQDILDRGWTTTDYDAAIASLQKQN